MYDIFFRKKPLHLLLNIKVGSNPKNISVLSRDTNCTYSHVVKLLDIFKEMGLVNLERSGRQKFVKLTDKGFNLAVHLEEALKMVK